MDVTFLFLLWLFLTITPPCIAYYRYHNNALAITVFSIFLNWTAVGFIASLIWSFTGNTRQKSNP